MNITINYNEFEGRRERRVIESIAATYSALSPHPISSLELSVFADVNGLQAKGQFEAGGVAWETPPINLKLTPIKIRKIILRNINRFKVHLRESGRVLT